MNQKLRLSDKLEERLRDLVLDTGVDNIYVEVPKEILIP